MSFFVYFAVLLVAAASALFGLDLLTSPLPPERPKTQVATTANSATPPAAEASNKNLKREAKREAARQAANKSANQAALTPVYPAAPGADLNKTETAENTDVRMVYPPTNATTGVASADEKAARSTDVQPTTAAASNQSAAVAAQPQQQQPPQATQAPSAPEPTVQAAAPATESATAHVEPVATQAEPAATPVPAAQPAAQKSANSCNISACAAAYRSFRAEDCTYQPYSGPRQVCEKPAAGQERTADSGKSRHAEARAERATRATRDEARMRDIVRRVKQLSQDEDGDFYDVPMRGRRVIVIERDSGDFWR